MPIIFEVNKKSLENHRGNLNFLRAIFFEDPHLRINRFKQNLWWLHFLFLLKIIFCPILRDDIFYPQFHYHRLYILCMFFSENAKAKKIPSSCKKRKTPQSGFSPFLCCKKILEPFAVPHKEEKVRRAVVRELSIQGLIYW